MAVKPVVTKTVVKKAAPKPASKPVVKAVSKAKKASAPAKPAPKKPATKAAAKPAATVAPAKPPKLKKPKMVRDSFTFPKAEYAVLDGLKMRAAKLGSPAKKTELLRAGIKAIAAMQDAAFVAALKSVPSLKTGRPAKAE
nr:hypothetical protein [Rhodoferax sp.]